MYTRGLLLAFAAFAASGEAQVRNRVNIDSAVVVDADGRIAISSRRGGLTVHTWAEPRVRVQLAVPVGDSLKFARQGGVVQVARVATMTSDTAHMVVWVPRRATIEVNVADGGVEIANTDGNVLIRSATGDVKGSGLNGATTINASSGNVEVVSSRGSISVTSSAGNVTVVNAAGDVEALSNAGTIALQDVCSSRVTARTLRGDVALSGEVRPTSDYTLNSHSGAVTVTVVADPDVTVQARTVNGNFRSSIDGRLVVRDTGHDYVIGKGTGTIKASTFSGPIRIERDAGATVTVARDSRCK